MCVPHTGKPLTREQLIPEIGAFMMAGFDTSSHTIAWCLFTLATHPDAQERVRGELRERGLLVEPGVWLLRACVRVCVCVDGSVWQQCAARSYVERCTKMYKHVEHKHVEHVRLSLFFSSKAHATQHRHVAYDRSTGTNPFTCRDISVSLVRNLA